MENPISTVLADARKAVMNLPMEDRIMLAHELLEGLQEEPISLEEMDRRLAEMHSGNAEMISIEDLEERMHEAIHGKKRLK